MEDSDTNAAIVKGRTSARTAGGDTNAETAVDLRSANMEFAEISAESAVDQRSAHIIRGADLVPNVKILYASGAKEDGSAAHPISRTT